MNRIREYFIGDILKSTDDPFEQARAILLFRLCLMFSISFLLPVISDIALGYYKAMILHGIAYLVMFIMPVIIKKQQNIEKSVNLFFIVSFIISFLVFMMLQPASLDRIGAAWCILFLALSGILQRGKIRIWYCCFINWLPLVYVIINEKLNGAITWDPIVQPGVVHPPVFLIIIPMVLIVYAILANSSTVQQARHIITEQKKIISEKNKDIIDSIQYAKRLQDALLPSVEIINKHLSENFILYKPKDIVAGDFYWFENYNDLIFVAAADCTGHGVPGAMVSVVCSGALTRAVKEFNLTKTDQILNKTRELVLETFSKNNSEVKDGMDISLLCIDKENKKIFWSGANNSLWYIVPTLSSSAGDVRKMEEDNSSNLIEIKADKQPIGKTDLAKPFSSHQIDYKEGSIFYLFTDGYADQFGGKKGKKFKYRQLLELLTANSKLDLNSQKEQLNKVFEQWKDKLEQVDDVCIIGIKL